MPVGFGTWAVGGTDWGFMDERSGKALVRHAWDAGFRHFDTAESYGNGRAELLLGQALKQELRTRRDEVEISGKTVVRPPSSMRKHLERSLRRGGFDYFDIYAVHWPRQGLDLLRAVEALDRAREDGLVRRIGLCNVGPPEVRAAAAVAPVESVQFGYNLLWRHPETQGLTSLAEPTVAYSPLAQGLLARSFLRSPEWEAGDHRPKTPLFSPPAWEHVHRFNQTYISRCRDVGVHPAAVALRWVTDRVGGAVVGGRTTDDPTALAEGLAALTSSADAVRTILDEMTALSEELQKQLPALPNMFGYIPTPVRSEAPPCRKR